MATVMTAKEFVTKVKDVANNYKTLYVMGCFGAPMNASNKKRYINHHSYNTQATRTKMINAATADTFGFDCVCLIKGILWGWNGDKSKTYGGAVYASNGVSDAHNADGMIGICKNVSSDFGSIAIGECLWGPGHVGVYIGDGLAVECTPAWKNGVQVTAVGNIGNKVGYPTRIWTKHGKLPYISYNAGTEVTSTKKPAKVKVDVAKKRDKTLTGEYEVTAAISLHIRTGAGTTKTSLGTLKKGTKVHNYGYYNVASNGTKWLYVATDDKVLGYCSMRYLKKC